ncbi:hypothetical protein BP00DRAFT_423870 [Aspergillus indologenus CBS 114.80]|uniref:Uncharacterized protein n=1 Tax=Aspergillus indologenus CBS 114.80 TaxID=1450541 RepID=A0A2V5IA88_9EURO|nr:hypothetical protein BP00DRAFT_423870 [Aspergillus indologenus CBS 114.80]
MSILNSNHLDKMISPIIEPYHERDRQLDKVEKRRTYPTAKSGINRVIQNTISETRSICPGLVGGRRYMLTSIPRRIIHSCDNSKFYRLSAFGGSSGWFDIHGDGSALEVWSQCSVMQSANGTT